MTLLHAGGVTVVPRLTVAAAFGPTAAYRIFTVVVGVEERFVISRLHSLPDQRHQPFELGPVTWVGRQVNLRN